MDTNELLIPVSYGEMCDRFIILGIKLKYITDTLKLKVIRSQYKQLQPIFNTFICAYNTEKISNLIKELTNINETIWILIEKIQQSPDDMHLYINIYKNNVLRVKIKNKIDELTTSNIEIKSYI